MDLKPKECYSLIKSKKMKRNLKIVEVLSRNYCSLSDKAINQIVTAAQDAFGANMSKEEILERIYPTDRLYLGILDNEISSFGTAIVENDNLHYVAAIVKQSAQDSQAFSALTVRMINLAMELNKNKLKCHTQNPKIELSILRQFKLLSELGLINNFNVNRIKLEKHYGRMLTKDKPNSGASEIDSIYSKLNYENGDAYLLNFDWD